MVAAVKANADPALPTKGGLSRRFKTGVGVRTRVAGQSVGVRIVGKNGYDVEAIDAGYVRHPVFGNRKAWVLQRVQAGWFTKPIEAQEHTVRAEVLNAIDRVARKVEG